jgi:hypothetical protein
MVTGPQAAAGGDKQQGAARQGSDEGWGGVGGWANAQGLQLQQAHIQKKKQLSSGFV